ncbi:MAG: hypothetical protein LBV67_11205 [Streptococcaceae bacterium]|jgi:hypothetical protein|nr:hypothetical protein [Streptococcaceae bacterium]
MVKITITGLEQALKKIDMVPEKLQAGLVEATKEMLLTMDGLTKQKLKETVQYGYGQIAGNNKQSIEEKPGKVTARFWNDSEIGSFREFGTGKVGEENNQGIAPDVNPTYTQYPWFIPVDQVRLDLNQIYGMPVTDNKISDNFYITDGQPARPWFYPATQKVIENHEKTLEHVINQKLRELE